jgi:hypothetical protein
MSTGMATGPDGTDPRIPPVQQGDERATLTGFLRWQRDTFRLKCAGLDAAQLATRAVEPSPLSLLGLIRHLAEAERNWWQRVWSLEPVPGVFGEDSFTAVRPDPELVGAAWRAWEAEVEAGDRFVLQAPDLEPVGYDADAGAVSLRWVLVHLIEEYARHNGHADLLRERIDGAGGD